MISTISVEQLRAGDFKLIDVRTQAEFETLHATGAQNFPLDSLDPDSLTKDEKKIAVICQSGQRSLKASGKLLAAGIKNVVSVEGGTAAWQKAGLHGTRGKRTISLERQVQIVAGSITLAGVIAALISGNVYLAGIPAFIGAGLIFSGITDTCGMALVLAKMPWNSGKPA
ncbi:MAG: rhodanese-like domain-containing protein [Planctomycetota bacterium]|nr:rhodanese-like domain-containing protein [Planctomycetota bacterium]